MYLGNNAAIRGCQEYFNRCAAAGSPIGATQTPTAYDNAASFTAASSQSLTSTASNLQCQSQSFTVAGWFFMPSTAAAWVTLISQGIHPVNANGGFVLQRNDGNNNLLLQLRNDNASNSVPLASATLSTNAWNFVECGWDSTLNQSFISINGGTRVLSTAFTGWTFPNTTISTRIARSPFGDFLTGNLAGWGLWKRVLTSGTNSEIAALWNSGAGRTYASLDSGLRTNLVSWWALNGSSSAVSLTDSHTGGNNLTNTGSVTAPNIGPVVTALSDPRQLIVDFAQGIDRLGLWNSMVCWPLRASQNAQTGTTAFSLGGLGQFNGTLVGTPLPIRTADGVTFGGSGQYIEYSPNFNVDFTKGGFSLYAVWSGMGVPVGNLEGNLELFTSTSLDVRHRLTTNFLGGTSWTPSAQNYNGNVYQPNPATNQPIVGNVVYGWNADTLTLQRDGNDLTTSPSASAVRVNGAYTIRTTGRNNSTTAATSRVSHLIAFAPSIGMTSQRMALIHSLYRQTLGLGLGLP